MNTHTATPAHVPASAEPNPFRAWKLDADRFESLSNREREIIAEMLGGIGPKIIARRLFISEHTVRNHLKSIFRKLDVNSQLRLVCKVFGTCR